jgi:hypothetical protein
MNLNRTNKELEANAGRLHYRIVFRLVPRLTA